MDTDQRPAKYIEFPLSTYATWQYDAVLDDQKRIIGISTYVGFSWNERAMVSLAVLDPEYAAPGTRVTVLWGEPDGELGVVPGLSHTARWRSARPSRRSHSASMPGLTWQRLDAGAKDVDPLVRGWIPRAVWQLGCSLKSQQRGIRSWNLRAVPTLRAPRPVHSGYHTSRLAHSRSSARRPPRAPSSAAALSHVPPRAPPAPRSRCTADTV